MRVFGTAGHVDHGKSTLVKTLTGMDPDRLAEEKSREMTIDLGFAWMDLDGGERIGIVDVPGHRDFIENMLAGVGGIDAALLVIAADEGVMPQTREHLAILDLLGIEFGIIVLTKIDLVDSTDWLDLVEQDIRTLVAKTGLAHAEILPVSARGGIGLSQLTVQMQSLITHMPPTEDSLTPRLPIDRVFSISGFGTVVTGTLVGGSLKIGDEIELQPSGFHARIRGMQSYNEVLDVARPGRRLAVNLAGVNHAEVKRGQVVTLPGLLEPTSLLDARFRHLADTSRPLKHNSEVKLFAGAAEVSGHVRLLADELLPSDAESWLQIRLDQHLAVSHGDRFILRYPSPSETIGGGIVVNPHPARRWKRFDSSVIQSLETRLLGSPAERVVQAANRKEPVNRIDLQRQIGYTATEIESAIKSALSSGHLIALSEEAFLSRLSYQQAVDELTNQLREYHRIHPLRLGMLREELRARFNIKPYTFSLLLDSQQQIISRQEYVFLLNHKIHFNHDQQQRIAKLKSKFQELPYNPPSFKESAQIVGEDVLFALIDLGEIIQVQPDVIFPASIYKEMLETVLALIDERGGLSANELRDRFGTTRKYAIGLLEYLDELNITCRVGDVRVRASKSL